MVTRHPATRASSLSVIANVSARYRGSADFAPWHAVCLVGLTMLVEVVFQYRTLIGKCELGVGLDWDEIEQMTAIESAFAPSPDDCRMKAGRRFRREPIQHTALLRGDRINDRVDVIEIGPGGVVIRNAPFVAQGEPVELVMEAGNNSYRFRAEGVWLKDDDDDYRVGLALIGMPVCLRSVAVSRHETDLVDRIGIAAAA